jgi:hypothetical protein
MATKRTADSKLAADKGGLAAVRWRDVAPTVRAVAATSDASLAAVSQLMLGLTEPLRQLDRISELTARAIEGDDDAAVELRRQLSALHAQIGRPPTVQTQPGCGCECHADQPSRATSALDRATDAARPGDAAPSRDSAHQEFALLDDAALVGLTLSIARLYAGSEVCASPQSRRQASS